MTSRFYGIFFFLSQIRNKGYSRFKFQNKTVGVRAFLSDSLFFLLIWFKKPTFAQITKALLHQTPYFNFTILFFNISLLFYFIFLQLPKYYTTKKHYYTKKISFVFPQLMNSGSLIWGRGSHCWSTTGFQWFGEADVSHFCCLFLIFCVFRPIVNSDKNALTNKNLFFFGEKK